jgi:hypothetical protein
MIAEGENAMRRRGDGKTTGRKIVPLTDLAPMTNQKFPVPFGPADKKWIRFAVWDSAGNGSFAQPVRLHRRRSPLQIGNLPLRVVQSAGIYT